MKPVIQLGRYIPAHTIIHRLDPRIKFILTMEMITVLCLGKTFLLFALTAVLIIFAAALARISLFSLIQTILPIFGIVSFTVGVNIFFIEGKTVLWQWRFLRISQEGLYFAAFICSRIMLLVTASSLMTFTTAPIELTDGLEYLLRPLNRLGFPAGAFAMTLNIALRFIPILQEETQKIMQAQIARGASFGTGGLFKRAKAFIPIIIPLFISALQRAEDLALAMEARCYHAGKARTRMHPLCCSRSDIHIFTVCNAVFVFLMWMDSRFAY